MANEVATLRRWFTEAPCCEHFLPTDWTPTFEMLRETKAVQRIQLKNRETGRLELFDFTVVGATESPITTTKWIWGRIITDDDSLVDLTFDYVDGRLVDISTSMTAKSLPIEECARRLRNIRYPAEITNFDIFSPTE